MPEENWAGRGFTRPYREIPADPQDDDQDEADEDDWIFE